MNLKKLFFAVISSVIFAGAFALATQAAEAPKTGSRFDESKAVAYRINRNDVLGVMVFGEADLTGGGKKVEARGTINMALIQEIRVVGLTVLEAQAAIEKAYRDGRFLRNPQVTITVEQNAPRVIAVQGKVNSPGRYEIPADQVFTVKDAIIRANGFSETAKGTAVRVTRTMPDGSIKTFEDLDIDSVIRGKSKAKAGDANFVLEPDDIVYVPEKII